MSLTYFLDLYSGVSLLITLALLIANNIWNRLRGRSYRCGNCHVQKTLDSRFIHISDINSSNLYYDRSAGIPGSATGKHAVTATK